MIKSWRSQWCAPSDAIFGVATLAAGGSEGHDRSMASMRFAQTASYGVLPNALLPRTFVAQVYDLGDPWASVGDGGSDAQNCSKVDPTTGRYGPNCSKWDAAEWSPGVAAYAPLVLSVLWFNNPFTAQGAAGSAIAIAGVLMYSLAKARSA